ncbi:hypothetical protein D3C80_1873790 [compost metagenome]
MAPALQQAADGIDQRVDGHAAEQNAVERQYHGLQVPETHGEALAQLARHLHAGGVRSDQLDHHQRQPAHAGVDQRVHTVEDDGERAGGKAEGDADSGDE